LAACARQTPDGVLVHLRLADGTPRPTFALLTWTLPDGHALPDVRVPDKGGFPAAGAELATVFVETRGGLQGERKLFARGMTSGGQVCSGAARVRAEAEVTVALQAALPDSDGDGVPDAIDDDCGSPGCRPVDAGADGGPAPVEAGAERPAAPDTRPPDAPAAERPPPDASGRDTPAPDAPAPDVRPTPDTAPDAPGPRTIEFATFTNATGVKLNGSATVRSGAIALAGLAKYQVGSFYVTTPIVLGADVDVDVAFAFRITPNPTLAGGYGPGDGMTFVLQNAPAGTAALGEGGRGEGAGGLVPSVAVEIDLFKNDVWDPSGDHVAFLRDGDYTMHLPNATSPPFDVKSGMTAYVWVEYRARAGQLSLYMARTTTRPQAPLLQYTVDLAAALGGRAFVGMAAAAGEAVALFEVLGFTVTWAPAR
jgi:hypothetical protein